MMPRLIVPMKSLAEGKSRLRSVLTDEARRQLNYGLLLRILTAASEFPGSTRTAVISECADVLGVAAAMGALPLRQAPGSNLNDALKQGVDALRERSGDAILIAAADLPLITADDLKKMADIGRGEREVVVWTDKHRRGTNALYLPNDVTLSFQFGHDSCAKHYREGVAATGGASIEIDPHIAFDIDTADDLRQWCDSGDALALDALRDVEGRIPATP